MPVTPARAITAWQVVPLNVRDRTRLLT